MKPKGCIFAQERWWGKTIKCYHFNCITITSGMFYHFILVNSHTEYADVTQTFILEWYHRYSDHLSFIILIIHSLLSPLPDYATISLFNPRYEALREREGQTASQLNGHEFEQTPGDSGQRNLACCSLWGRKDSDTTEQLTTTTTTSCLHKWWFPTR